MSAFTFVNGRGKVLLSSRRWPPRCNMTVCWYFLYTCFLIFCHTARPAFRATEQQISMMSPLRVGELPVDKSKQKRESAISYQEALRQQVQYHIRCIDMYLITTNRPGAFICNS